VNWNVRNSIVIVLLTLQTLEAGGKATIPATTPVLPVLPKKPFYVGVGGVSVFLRRDPCPCTPDGPEIEDTRYGGVIRAGWDFSPFLSLEARAFQTVGGDVFSKTRHYGIYLRPNYQLGNRVNLYALFGYGHTRIDYTNGIYSSTTSHNGIAYGGGIELDLFEESAFRGWGLFADFTQLLNHDGPKHTDANILSTGVVYRF